MKLLERIIASTLCAAVLTGVLTVAPFSVSAAEEQKNEQAVTSYVSEAEFEEETTAAAEQQTMAQTADGQPSDSPSGDTNTVKNDKQEEPVGADSFTSGDFTYTLSDKKATITKYTGSASSVTVPAKIDGYSVTAIDACAFENCEELTSVTLPDGLKTMGARIFRGTGVKTVTIPKTVEKMDSHEEWNDRSCFEGSAVETVIFESGITTIPVRACKSMSTLKNVTIPDTVTAIGNEAFIGCSSLTDFNIPESVKTIGDSSYAGCSFKSVTIPGKVNSIGSCAFENCENLTSITLPERLKTMGARIFRGTEVKTVTIPKTVEKMDSQVEWNDRSCFEGSAVETVIFESGITTIPVRACKSLSTLKDVTIPDTVTAIGNEAFSGCTSLPAFSIPETVKTIGNSSYEGCSFKSVTIPSKVTSIGAYAFKGCENLAEINLPDGLKTIDAGMLENCENLTSITLPERLKTMGARIFRGTEVKTVTIPKTVEKMDSQVEWNDRSCFEGSAVETVIFESGITTIPVRACKSLSTLKDVTIPDTVTAIGNEAFSGCTSLPAFSIPETVKTIGNSSYEGCSFKSVTIPSKVTSIGAYAFKGCENLAEINLPDGLKTMGARIFRGTEVKTVTIPKTVEKMDSQVEWNDRSCFEGSAVETVIFESGITTIPVRACKSLSTLKDVTIPDTVTAIGNEAFSGCTSLPAFSIPETVKTIGNSSYEGCSFKSVTIPSKVTSIGAYAFKGCENLAEINLPDGLKTIDAGMLENCENLTSITLPERLKTMGARIFRGTEVKTVTIPKTVEKMDSQVEWNDRSCFEGSAVETVIFESGITTIPVRACKSLSTLKDVTIPDTVTAIGNEAFSGCTSLPAFSIPETVKTIGNSSYEGCSFKSVTIPSKVTSIGAYAFKGCENLAEINLPDGLKTMGARIFRGTEVKTVTIPKTVEKMDSQVEWNDRSCFEGSAVETVIFESGITTIPVRACKSLSTLKDVTIPDTVTAIGNEAFSGCAELTALTLPESLTSIGKDVFTDCPKLTVYCPKFSKATVSAIDNGVNCISNNDKRTGSEKVLDVNNSRLSLTSSAGISVSCAYSIKNGAYGNAKNTEVKIYIPAGAQLADGTLYLDKTLCTDYTEKDNFISVPVTAKSGRISFKLDVAEDCRLQTYAILNYTLNGKTDYDIIDVVNEDVDLIAINTEEIISSPSIRLNGIAPAGRDVDIYLDGDKAATFTADKGGSYKGEVELSAPEDESVHTVKAVTTDNDGNEISAKTTVIYREKAPVLTAFNMSYNGTTYDLTEKKRHRVTFRLEGAHGVTPFEFTVRYDNPESIDKVYVTSTRNQVTKLMETEYDPDTKEFTAKGFFDENNHDYVPGKLSVQYITKSGNKGFDLETIDNEMNEKLPEVFDNAECEVISDTETHKEAVIKLSDGESITYTYDKLNSEEFAKCFESADKEPSPVGDKEETPEERYEKDSLNILGKILKEGWKFVKAGTKTVYYQVDGEEKSTTYWDYEAGQDYVVKETLNYSKKKAISSALVAVAGEEMAPIANSTGYFVYGIGKEYINYFGQAMDYNMAIAQVMASDIPEASKRRQIEYIQGLKMAAMDVACAKMVGSYFKFAGGLVMAECPPLGIALYAAGYAMADMWAKDPNVFDKLRMKFNSMNAAFMDFIIDPSGYVYAGVTSNRIEGATVTAYRIPFDGEDEAYWDEPDEAKAVVWDSEEYSQYNPLTTDADGNYSWDVPEGWWKVKVEKEGYETYTSEWMPVPPPQTDVNINLLNKAVPKITGATVDGSTINLVFSEYMDPETMQNIAVKDNKGNQVTYKLTYSKEDTSFEGNVYAKEFNLVFDEGYNTSGDTYTVEINGAKSYADVEFNGTEKIVKSGGNIIGDLNGDGKVTIDDATLVQKAIAEMISLNEDQKKAADTNGDGNITIDDATMIQKYVAELIDHLG